jgi:hypothetical protein
VTSTVKVAVPGVVGVPESVPAELKLIPAGRWPDSTDQVYGAAPPVAWKLKFKGVPTVAAGTLAEVTDNGPPDDDPLSPHEARQAIRNRMLANRLTRLPRYAVHFSI